MPAQGRAPASMYRLYRAVTYVLAPLAWQVVGRKLKRQGVQPHRRHEILGNTTAPRPRQPVIWLHGASVGESLSALTLIARLGDRLPKAEFLLTSGTATSAALAESRLPPRTRHQFAPLDAPGPVRRFLAHWRPRAAIFVESELWPVTLAETRASGAQLALVNARLSPRSVDGWCKFPDTARFVMDQFALILTQNPSAAEDLRRMGADPSRLLPGGNLKAFAPALPVDPQALAALKAALSGRPHWLAASTHPGEEAPVLAAHQRLLAERPDLCLILAPRHPDRAGEIARLIAEHGLTHTTRSKGESTGAQVYLADTLGEMGLWYDLAPFAFLGGSLTDMGGHNPFEPAQMATPILTGPHLRNFPESFAPLLMAGGAVQVEDAASLERAARHWLDDPEARADAGLAAKGCAKANDSALDAMIDRLLVSLQITP